jgi:hypothetical protein
MACGATLDHVAKPLVLLEVDLTASQSLVQDAAGIAIAPLLTAFRPPPPADTVAMFRRMPSPRAMSPPIHVFLVIRRRKSPLLIRGTERRQLRWHGQPARADR